MKKQTDEGTAKVQDYSDEKDGSNQVDVNYSFTWEEFETESELREHYSVADLVKLANQREKQTANSGARQKAIAPFAQDPNSPAAVKEAMIKLALKHKPTLSREQAEAFVDSLGA